MSDALILPFRGPGRSPRRRYPAGVTVPLPPDEQDLVARVREKVARLHEIRAQERQALDDLDQTLRDSAGVIHRMGPAEFARAVGDDLIGKEKVRRAVGPARNRQRD